jgi:hypothetical protein
MISHEYCHVHQLHPAFLDPSDRSVRASYFLPCSAKSSKVVIKTNNQIF